jgi:LemA protein
MEAEERIDRMERSGLISTRQAQQLRASIRPAADHRPKERQPRPVWPYLLAALALIVLAALLVAPGGIQPVQDVSRTLNDAGAQGAMNKPILNLIAAVLLLLIPVLLLAIVYNGLVNREETVFKAWAQVESQFQRRADLVPSLVEIVSAYARHERQTLAEVTDARGRSLARAIEELVQNQADSASLLSDDAGVVNDQALMDRLARVQGELGQRMSGVLALAEDYPELRASDQFLELQAQLEGTENRINVARLQFNEAVGGYNAAIRRLPGTLVAGLGSFQRKAYFRSEEPAANAPEIEFD